MQVSAPSAQALRPTLPLLKGPFMSEYTCPCGEPATRQTWETHLYLCLPHARQWLICEEKKIADIAIEEKNDGALEAAVLAFIKRIGARPGVFARMKIAVNVLLGR